MDILDDIFFFKVNYSFNLTEMASNCINENVKIKLLTLYHINNMNIITGMYYL